MNQTENISFERMQGLLGLNVAIAKPAKDSKSKAVFLLHGFPEFWYSWRHQISALRNAGFHVFAPDLRGYNLSDKPHGVSSYHLRLIVEDIACLIKESGYQRVHLAGHDWGGVIAWTLAGQYPELLDRLVILNAPHPKIFARKVRTPPQMFMSWYVLFFQLPFLPELLLRANNYSYLRKTFRKTKCEAFSEAEIDRYIEAISRPQALHSALNYYRAMFRFKDARELARQAKTEAETLVIWGEKDLALSVKLLDGLSELAPNLSIHRIAAAGHWVQNEAADEVSRKMIHFFSD